MKSDSTKLSIQLVNETYFIQHVVLPRHSNFPKKNKNKSKEGLGVPLISFQL